MTLEAYRVDTGVAVDDATAQEAWSRAARPVLTQISKRYGSLTAPDDLAEALQVLSGVRTREPAELWLGEVLDAVDIECSARKEPLLSAFCVGEDGRMGERYEKLATSLGPTTVTDIEMHAATQRLEAHRYHGAVVPVDGGRPVLPRQLATLRASAPRAAAKAPTGARPTRTRTAAPRKPKKPDPTVGTLQRLVDAAGEQLRISADVTTGVPAPARSPEEHARRLVDVLLLADAIPGRPRPRVLEAPRLVSV